MKHWANAANDGLRRRSSHSCK